jgi:hypothetical protein
LIGDFELEFVVSEDGAEVTAGPATDSLKKRLPDAKAKKSSALSLKVVEVPDLNHEQTGRKERRRVLPGKLPIVPQLGQGARQEV